MGDSGIEHKEELESLSQRVKIIEGLADASEGKLLGSQSSHDAQNALYEWNFYLAALFQVEAIRERVGFKDEADVKETVGWAQRSKELEEEMRSGKWYGTKEEFRRYRMVSSYDLDPNRAEQLGLDPNLEFNGVKLFQSGFSGDNEVWQNFVDQQLSLIPDETEPYEHSDIGELIRNVENPS